MSPAAPTIRTLNRRPAASGARVPPHNLGAEESLLGAMLLSRGAIEAAVEVGLTADSFYKPAHGHIYDAVTSLYAQGEPADPVTVADELSRADLLEAVGGPAVLISLQAGTPAIGNAGRYATIVQEHATLRRLIDVAGEIAEIGYSLPDDVESAVDQAEASLYHLRREPDDPRSGDIRAQLSEEWLAGVQARADAGGVIDCPTGLRDLDEMVGGLQPSRLYLVAGRPGSGKTDLACTIAANMAANPTRGAVLYHSIEMDRAEVLGRLVCAHAGLDRHRVERGKIWGRDWDRLGPAMEQVSELALDIRDSPICTLLGLRAVARRVASRRGLGLVVVDHIGLMTGRGVAAENRQVEVAELARGLKLLARDLSVPVVCCVQLNRGLESRHDKRPMLADLRESGELEQSADVVIGVYRDELYNPQTPDRGVAELLVLKQRNGPTGPVRVSADVVTGRWRDLAREAV